MALVGGREPAGMLKLQGQHAVTEYREPTGKVARNDMQRRRFQIADEVMVGMRARYGVTVNGPCRVGGTAMNGTQMRGVLALGEMVNGEATEGPPLILAATRAAKVALDAHYGGGDDIHEIIP